MSVLASAPTSRPGSLILLTGPSGSGKTTVGQFLTRVLPGRWLFWEADRRQPEPPPSGPATVEMDLAMTRANLAAMNAYVGEGFSVIGEVDIAGNRRPLVEQVLGHRQPFIVVLDVSATTVEARERPGHDPAFASWHARHTDWSALPADLHVSTEGPSVEAVTETIRAAWMGAVSTAGSEP